MKPFPLQDQLIDSVIAFANAELNDPSDVLRFFGKFWLPGELPRLKTCRVTQADARSWLIFAADYSDRDCFAALRGLEDDYKGSYIRVDPGIRLEGFVTVSKVKVLGGHQDQIVWDWRVSNASLRAICGLAVGTIIQEGLHRKIGECARFGCSNIYLDKNSRGVERKFCKLEYCDKMLNRDRVEANRLGLTLDDLNKRRMVLE